jgi:hypothetical protein
VGTVGALGKEWWEDEAGWGVLRGTIVVAASRD